MTKRKSPYKGLTAAEVNKAERNSFIIRIGNDAYCKDGTFVFSLAQAEKYYNVLLDNILYTIKNGDEKQVSAATKCLQNLNILPLRIQ